MPSSYFTGLRNAVRNGIRKSVIGQQVGLQDSVQTLIGQGNLQFGNYRLFHSVIFSSLTDLHALLLPRTVFAASLDSLLLNRRRNFSVVGALSRPFSVPSVSGPSFQVCGYHIDRALSEDGQSPGNSNLQNKPMATSTSRAVFNGCMDNFTTRNRHLPLPKNNSGVSYSIKSSDNRRMASMSLKNRGQSNNYLISAYFLYYVSKKWCNFPPNMGSESRDFHSSLPAYLSAGTASDVSFDNSTHEEQLASPADLSEQKVPAGKTLKLLSASCYLPHPDKEETGGEDAHFIVNEHAIGVADGVGGWADLGVNSGLYSRELMSNAVTAIQEEPKGLVDPARVLEKAHSSTKARGSSTACIIALTEQGLLHAINLGDSGFMVVRDGCTIFRSPVQQHDFNFTYQLESGSNGDLPSSGQVFTVPVAPGDVIIAGTDGLFDNLYNNEITAVVVHAVRAGLEAQVTAQKIAALARQRAQDKDRQTPFSTAAQDAGFRYYGGKLDDITVVVSYIASHNEDNQPSK
ncbi:SpoIIE domain-containing protein [Cephalotus follicularis]|uniref:Protein phosphatase n=1 Tax=Cephalotus follicularis TaxID=3775 RepID=A0A1Q3DDQ9_CEPFO|nr:SpoIIE domain-containing protein [Cephalotus follicularis]